MYPQVVSGLGKLKNYKHELNINDSVTVTVVLYCLLLVQSQIALWDNANTMLSPSDQLTN